MPILWCPEIPGVAEPFSARHPDAALLIGEGEAAAARPAERFWLCGPCSSALDAAMHLAGRGELDVWDSVLASRQWSGRGQLRRGWVSEPGNLFAAWRLPVPSAPWQNMVSLLVGCALGEGLAIGAPVRRKWRTISAACRRPAESFEERGECVADRSELATCRTTRPCGATEPSRPTSYLISRRHIRFFLISSSNSHISTQSRTPRIHPPGVFTVKQEGAPLSPHPHKIWRQLIILLRVFAGLSPDGGIILDAGAERLTLHSGSLRPQE
jgi:BirA family biotin operon repressor/biotin-[acetyl-CoA-carboxylase] ligase